VPKHEMRTRLYIKQAIIAGIVAALAHVPAHSDVYNFFPGASADQRTLQAQRLVEQLYEDREFKRSLIIYEKELAPIGDKYAQYMVGFMYYRGHGVEADRPAALAWFRLAAERRDPPIVAARDALFSSMSQEEIVESNQIFVKLWRKLGDNQIILNLVRRDLNLLKEKTGSRIAGSNTSPMTIVRVQQNTTISSAAFYDRVRERLEMRLNFLNSNVEIVDIALNDDMAVKKSLEQEIREEMAALDMR
jgi:Sel1 repeat-containing protein